MPFKSNHQITDLPQRQLQAYNHFITALANHPFIHHIDLKGSLATGGDQWSDVDLHIACDTSHIDEVFSACWQKAHLFRKILLIEEVNFGLRQIVVIYDNHLHVDLYIGPQDTSTQLDQITKEDTWLESLNNALYTFHELDIALKRSDFLWAHRLASHILADISLYLCAVHSPHQAHLHLKNLQRSLPKELAAEIVNIHRLWGVANYKEALQTLISFVAKILYELPAHQQEKLRQNYFEYFATWPDRYGSRYQKLQTLPIEDIKVWVLSTECYRIRPLHMLDASMILSLLNSPGWLKYIGDRNVNTLQEAKDYIDRIQHMSNAAYWVIEKHPSVETGDDVCPNQNVHGVLTLLQRDHLPLPDLGFALLEASQGKGIVKEVSEQLIVQLRKQPEFRGLLAIVLPENVPSQKLLLHLGFKPWGTEAKDGEILIKYQLD